jgi:acetyltransferase
VGFATIISVGNKLDLSEIDFLEYFVEDEATEQIHLYLESVDQGRRFLELARASRKPIVVFKANVSRTAGEIARSHTAALAADDKIVNAALKQAGAVRVRSIHEMTVCAKALQLPPLRGNRLAGLSYSGGFSVIMADAMEKNGFVCPPLPRTMLDKIESYRRGGVIRMSNPLDFGDVHRGDALLFALEACLALENIDGLVLSLVYDPIIARLYGGEQNASTTMLRFFKGIGEKAGKPIALSFFAEKSFIEEFKKAGDFPVFNDVTESVQAMAMLREYWHGRSDEG